MSTHIDKPLEAQSREELIAEVARLRERYTLLEQAVRLGEHVTMACRHAHLPQPVGVSILLFDHDLRYTAAAGDTLALTGKHPAEIEGMTLGEVYREDLAPLLEPVYRDVLAGMQIEQEREIEGTSLYMQAMPLMKSDGLVDGGLVVVQDISSLRELEHRLIESEARFTDMANSAPLMVWATEADGTLSFVNQRWLNYTGVRMEGSRGLHWMDPVHPGDRVRFQHLLLASETPPEGFRFEMRMKNADGDYRWVLNHGIPRHQPDGPFVGWVGTCVDVTDMKEAADEREQLISGLQVFAQNVAHDLKNPLQLAMGFAALMRDNYSEASDEEKLHWLDVIVESTEKMESIIDGQLLLSEVEHTRVTPSLVNMKAVVDEVLKRLHADIRLSRAHIEQPDVWLNAMGYAPWIEQVWFNYLTNALKYGGQPPRIELTCSAAPDGCVTYTVRDYGPGIRAEELDSIYAGHNQPSKGGHGLGLSIVRLIVERQNGTLSAGNHPDGGAVFHFTLPAE